MLAAVKAFQAKIGYQQPDGIVGPTTWYRLKFKTDTIKTYCKKQRHQSLRVNPLPLGAALVVVPRLAPVTAAHSEEVVATPSVLKRFRPSSTHISRLAAIRLAMY